MCSRDRPIACCCTASSWLCSLSTRLRRTHGSSCRLPGVLMPSLVVSYSHGDHDIDLTIEAIDGALALYRRALDDGIKRYLEGRPSQPVYRPYNLPEVLPRKEDVGARHLVEARYRAPWQRIGALATALWLRPDRPPPGADHGLRARRLGNSRWPGGGHGRRHPVAATPVAAAANTVVPPRWLRPKSAHRWAPKQRRSSRSRSRPARATWSMLPAGRSSFTGTRPGP